MVFDWANVGTPFSWYFVAALFAGAAVARIFQRGRLTLVYLYLSVSIAAAAAGVLVPGVERFLDVRLAYFSAAVFVVSFFAFRYRIAIGVPVLLVVILVVTLFGVSLRGWLPVKGNGDELAEVRVLGENGGRTDLEITPLGAGQPGSTLTGTLPSGPVAPVIEALTFSPYYFFLASPVLCRFDGLVGKSGGATGSGLSLPGTTSAGTALVARFPGIHHRTLSGGAIQPVVLQKYRVQVSSDLVAGLRSSSQ